MATVDHIAIYINLTPKLQELLYAAKDHQKLFNYKWCWVIHRLTYRPRVSRASVDMSTDMLVDMLIESGCPIVDWHVDRWATDIPRWFTATCVLVTVQYCAKVMQMIIDGFCTLFSWFITDISANITWIAERENNKSSRYWYNLCDISPRYHSSETSLQQYLAKQNDISPRYIVAAKFVVAICRSELRFNNLS